MDIKDSYLHGTTGVVKAISVDADNNIKYTLADVVGTVNTVNQNLVTTTNAGQVPKADAAAGTIDSSSTDWVLTNNNGSIGWYKLPAAAFYYRPIKLNGTSILGTNNTALNLIPGSNINITNNGGDVTISSPNNTTISQAIPYIVGPSTDKTAGTWTGTCTGITEYSDGLTIMYVPAVAGASTTTLNINGLGAITCYYNNSNKMTTHYAVGTPILLTYVGGYWKRADYDSWTPYTSAYCDTSAATSAKKASCSSYNLADKSYVHVLIVYTNTASSALTLNINGTGAKPIYINGTTSSSTNCTLPAGTYMVYYDGANYHFRTDGIIPGKIEVASIATKVSCASATDNLDRPLVLTDTSNSVYYSTKITGNYSTGEIKATKFTGTFNGTANKVANNLVLKIKTGTTEGTDLYTYNGSSDKTLDIKQGSGITLTEAANSLTITNAGVRSVTTGTANGTISVNTNGTSNNVAVKGLGTAAYMSSSSLMSYADFADYVAARLSADLSSKAHETYIEYWGSSGWYNSKWGWIEAVDGFKGNLTGNVTGNVTGNSDTATKLKTARTIWGQSFDGSANVSGDMTGVGIINTILNLTTKSGNASVYLETATSTVDYAHIYVTNKADKTNVNRPLVLQDGFGDVGIGVAQPTQKLDVGGRVKATAFLGNIDGQYVSALTNYSKATSKAAITVTDTLNTALGKLEFKADAAYDLVKGAYDGDGTIENLAEILKVLEGIKDTDTIQAIVGKYLPLTGGTLTGKLTIEKDAFGSLVIYRKDSTNSASIQFKNGSDVSLGYLGVNTANGSLRRFTADASTSYAIWDSGNDGSGSGLDADLLDGTHKSELLTKLSNVDTTDNPKSISVTVGGTTKYLKVNHAVNSQVLQSTRYDNDDPTPKTTVGVTFQFSNLPSLSWHNVLTMKSYSDSNYVCSQLATPANNPGSDTGYSGNMKWRQGRNTTWSSWKTILDSDNYSSYLPFLNSSTVHATNSSVIYAPNSAGTSGQILTSSGGTPGWTNQSSLSVGYATSAGNADTVDGYHASSFHMNKIETAQPTGTAVGWYRCAQISSSNAGYSQNVLISLQRSYNSPQNEHYIFAISIGYNGQVSINQISGCIGGQRITKVRVVYNNSGKCYFDYYMATSNYNNSYKVEILAGDCISYQAPALISDAGGTAVEFTTVTGMKSNYSMYASSFYETSDRLLKTNIKSIEGSDNIPQLKEFDWKSNGTHSYGLIAQELEEQGYSELVSGSEDGNKTVNYTAALSLIVGKLQNKIAELEKEIQNLKMNK